MSSNHINVVTVILDTLLVSSLMLAGLSSAQCNSKTHGTSIENAELKRNPKLSSGKECYRDCDKNEKPMTCYYHFTIEHYPVLGSACSASTPNSTNSSKTNCQCITADGVERMMMSVNRMLPGPKIEVCKGDWVVIDVLNKLEGMETTIHWHGIFQNGSQYYDGVPMLTQCSIHQGNTFRYQWMAGNAGTHFWHSHSGLQKMDGVHGSLIVREKKSKEPNANLYEKDSPKHVIHINDWLHEGTSERFPGRMKTKTGQNPDSALINGKGQFKYPNGTKTNTPLKVFTVKPNCTYRFRFINAFSFACAAQFYIQGHNMTVIAADGVSVHPVTVKVMISYSGERWDFVLNTTKPPASYWIHIRLCQIYQNAILRYEGGAREPSSKAPTNNDSLPQGVVLNPSDGMCDSPREDAVCLNQLRSAENIDAGILKPEPDVKFVLPIDFTFFSPERLYRPNTYESFIVAGNGRSFQSTLGGISLKFPSSPPLSQIDDILPEEICHSGNKPANCGDICSCTHQLDIPLKAIVEMLVWNKANVPIPHPFHLHGYAFNVIGMGQFPAANTTNVTLTDDSVREMDRKGLLKRNWNKPPFKDTIAVPSNGWVLIRFRACNPGFWLFHCHFLQHLASGMGVIMHVGEKKDLPDIPPGFPTCGNYLPRITPAKVNPDKVSSCNGKNRNQDFLKLIWTRGRDKLHNIMPLFH